MASTKSIYIAKNGAKLGPYAVEEIGPLIAASQVSTNDLAWQQGMKDWKPLYDVIGAAVHVAQVGAPVQRPVLVWFICAYYLLFVPIKWILPIALSLINDATHDYQGASVTAHLLSNPHFLLIYGVSGFTALLSLIGAVLLFMLRRPALYLFILSFVIATTLLIYNLATRVGHVPVWGYITMPLFFTIRVAIIAYTWNLFRKGVLR